ncbi:MULTISPECIES: M48 family metallopeptidase [unclassified Shewanella]|uniref:M48 family metallopeptidase n=1 Tax=unclassified Shewanella TaxID=196818 RepID=UPI00354B4F0C
MIEQIDGHILAPKNATKYPASMVLGANGMLTVSSEPFSGQHQLETTEISAALGNTPRNITFNSGHVFVASQSQHLNQWLTKHSKPSVINKLEQHLGLIVVACIVTVIVTYSTIVYGVPTASKLIANMVPHSVEKQVGDYSLSLVEEMGFSESSLTSDRQAELQLLFSDTVNKLPQQAELFSQPPQLLIFSSKEGANAFAMAGGHIILTDEMIELADNDSQLQAVLLHELGHIRHRHIMTSIVQSSILSIAAAMIVGEASGIADTLMSVTVLGTSLSYSRHHEHEADNFAAEHLHNWYQNTDSLVSLYKLLQSKHQIDIPDWASTHPNLEDRMAELKKYSQNQ